MELARKLTRAAKMLEPGALRVRLGTCPACGPTAFLKLAALETAVRCLRCHASAIHLSIIEVLKTVAPGMGGRDVYEMSSRGPLVRFLQRSGTRLTTSEYFDDTAPGDWRGDIQCQDVQRLTYPDASFDLCTSTEVFEHVPDDLAGFREVRRVLRPGGLFVFTVPLAPAMSTVTRAVLRDGRIEHLLPPEYHLDTLRGENTVLCFRDYGADIVERVVAAGFASAEIRAIDGSAWWGFARPAIVARV